jgi:hypothetical protein
MSDPFQEPMSDQFDTSKYGQIQKQQGAVDQEQGPDDVGERSVPEVLADIGAQLRFSTALLRDVQAQLDRIESMVTGSPQQQPFPQQSGNFGIAEQNS